MKGTPALQTMVRSTEGLDIAVASNYILPGEDFPRRN